MIRGVGRGFIGGFWGLILIGLALASVTVCWCCWCYNLFEKRRRRLSLAQHADSELTLREDSPKFLKLLANKENVRRLSNINIENEGLKCVVEYSGSVCPYATSDHYNNCDTTSMPSRNIAIPYSDD